MNTLLKSILAIALLAVGVDAIGADRFLSRMKRDDKNGDGRLTLAEFTGPARLFKQLDRDGDGVLILTGSAVTLKAIREKNGPGAGNPSRTMRPGTAPQRTSVTPSRLSVKPDRENVRYGGHERHVLDIYQPKTKDGTPTPCMIWIHGGGFRRGDKSEGRLFSRHFIQSGITYITLNYRLSQHAIAPACFDDCARALQFIGRNAKKWNIDPARIAVGGGSAGAGLAQWLAFNRGHVGSDSIRVSALVLLNAQTSFDFRWIREHIPGDAWKGDGLQQLFGYSIENVAGISNEKYRLIQECSPMTYFDADSPPILFFYRRSKDPEIAVQNAMVGIHHPIFGLELKKRADEMDVHCEVFTVENEKDRAFYNNRWDHAVRFLKRRFQTE